MSDLRIDESRLGTSGDYPDFWLLQIDGWLVEFGRNNVTRMFVVTEGTESRIQLRSATLPLRSLNQFSKDGLRLLEAKAFPRSQVQPPFYLGYKLIADRSRIGSFRNVLPEQPVKVLIQPPFPR